MDLQIENPVDVKAVKVKACKLENDLKLILAGTVTVARVSQSCAICTIGGVELYTGGEKVRLIGAECCVPAWALAKVEQAKETILGL